MRLGADRPCSCGNCQGWGNEAPEPEGEASTEGWGDIQREGAGKYPNLTLLPFSPLPQVSQGA